MLLLCTQLPTLWEDQGLKMFCRKPLRRANSKSDYDFSNALQAKVQNFKGAKLQPNLKCSYSDAKSVLKNRKRLSSTDTRNSIATVTDVSKPTDYVPYHD